MPRQDLAGRLVTVLQGPLGGDVAVEDLARMAGGSSRETWSFTAAAPGAAPRRLVLRTDPPGAPSPNLPIEAQLFAAASARGVPVPLVVASGDRTSPLGAAFVVMEHVEGETLPKRIVSEPSLAAARRGLARRCGEVLAAIHSIPVGEVPGLAGQDPVAELRQLAGNLDRPHPAFEMAFRWLAEHRPVDVPPTVVHGDFRNGNLIVSPSGLAAVLDWELAHVGDPREDLGWLCAPCWRFGSPLRAGGFGAAEDLLEGYESAGGRHVGLDELAWFEVLGSLRWGVFCILQAWLHTSGAVPSVELAAIGRRVCEVEWDLLGQLGVLDAVAARTGTDPGARPVGSGAWPARSGARPGGSGAPHVGTGAAAAAVDIPHDMPTMAQLLEAVEGFLAGDVAASATGRLRFHARVAAHAAEMVRRQMALGPGQAAAHAEALAGLGVGSERELAAGIRSGAIEAGDPRVEDAVTATVAAKLAVANPAYLERGGAHLAAAETPTERGEANTGSDQG